MSSSIYNEVDWFTNECHCTSIETIDLLRLARALLTLIGSCRIYYVFNIKARSTFSILPLQSLCQGNNLFEFACLGKILFTFWYHGFYYQRWSASSSFGWLFLDPRLGIIAGIYFDTRWVDPNGVCSAVGTHHPRDTGKCSIPSLSSFLMTVYV